MPQWCADDKVEAFLPAALELQRVFAFFNSRLLDGSQLPVPDHGTGVQRVQQQLAQSHPIDLRSISIFFWSEISHGILIIHDRAVVFDHFHGLALWTGMLLEVTHEIGVLQSELSSTRVQAGGTSLVATEGLAVKFEDCAGKNVDLKESGENETRRTSPENGNANVTHDGLLL